MRGCQLKSKDRQSQQPTESSEKSLRFADVKWKERNDQNDEVNTLEFRFVFRWDDHRI